MSFLLLNKFLTDLINNQKPVSVYLKNGVRLKGYLTSVDQGIIFLKDQNGIQMIYKNLISTVTPNE